MHNTEVHNVRKERECLTLTIPYTLYVNALQNNFHTHCENKLSVHVSICTLMVHWFVGIKIFDVDIGMNKIPSY